ncbi:hypothetical protein IT570_02195 [Candidatus Sumerlaeota bacterium]|nr:hypothetical protein [Candidatus Sumerlaeota bacterium]
MARPVPHSNFLAELSKRLRATPLDSMRSPVLLAANPFGKMAIVNDAGAPDLHLYDRKTSQLAARLSLPARWRKPSDYRHFAFSDDGLHAAAYYPSDKSFAIWSVETGALVNQIQGDGKFIGRTTFLPGNQVVVCDGPWVNTHQVGGGSVARTKLAPELASVILYSASGVNGGIIAVGAFKMEQRGHQIRSFIMQDGKIINTADGPYRAGAVQRGHKKTVKFQEIYPIPGSTRRILILSEEECTEKEDAGYHSLEEDEYDTHLLAIDPSNGRFFPEEIYLAGRYCLEMEGREMHLLDERGFRRRIHPFPLRMEVIDWRISE